MNVSEMEATVYANRSDYLADLAFLQSVWGGMEDGDWFMECDRCGVCVWLDYDATGDGCPHCDTGLLAG